MFASTRLLLKQHSHFEFTLASIGVQMNIFYIIGVLVVVVVVAGFFGLG